ncbi:MAG: alpha-L-fucosidase [Candidatus Cryptobacteroides sp.]
MKFRLFTMIAAAFVALSSCNNPKTSPDPGEGTENTDPKPEDKPDSAPQPTPDPDVKDPEGFGPLPTPAQVAWQRMETNMFIHFGPNTFTNLEWGHGTAEEIAAFCPTVVDCDQWASIAAECDFKGIILTAKHHDGFCLWPNKNSSHTIAQSSYKDGKGDIVKELSEACAKAGVKFGIYDSPWDRHDPSYGTGDAYNQVFKSTVEDLHTNYGDLFEQWFDGAKGEDGKTQNYDFTLFNNAVLELHPDCVIFSNVGPGCRWGGQEWGYALPTCWSTFSPSAHNASQSSLPGDYETYLGSGDNPKTSGAKWLPIECDTSIRTKDQQDNGYPMWFWNNLGNERTRSAKNLMQLYYQSVGRNGLLLLNVPPTTAGVFDDADIKSLREFKKMKDEVFAVNLAEGASVKASKVRGNNEEKYGPANMIDGNYDTYFATDDNVTSVEIEFTLKEPAEFNRVLLQEYIPLGQRVRDFSIKYKAEGSESWQDLKWKRGSGETKVNPTTIGHKRILLTNRVKASAVKVIINASYACPVLNGFGLYNDTVTGLNNNNLDANNK